MAKYLGKFEGRHLELLKLIEFISRSSLLFCNIVLASKLRNYRIAIFPIEFTWYYSIHLRSMYAGYL